MTRNPLILSALVCEGWTGWTAEMWAVGRQRGGVLMGTRFDGICSALLASRHPAGVHAAFLASN
eukprot:229897-Chlamydomonas_euryale.AAC.20